MKPDKPKYFYQHEAHMMYDALRVVEQYFADPDGGDAESTERVIRRVFSHIHRNQAA